MNNKYLIGLAVVVAVLVGFGLGHVSAPTLAGDFAGGIVPQLHTATTTGGLLGNGYISANGSLSDDANNGLSIGGNDQYHGLTAYVSASGTPSAVATLGAFGSTTSSATTTVTVPESAGIALGAICSGGSNNTSTVISGCLLLSTNGATGTALVVYQNITGASVSVVSTTVFRISFDELPY
jgi:hypothetical protein